MSLQAPGTEGASLQAVLVFGFDDRRVLSESAQPGSELFRTPLLFVGSEAFRFSSFAFRFGFYTFRFSFYAFRFSPFAFRVGFLAFRFRSEAFLLGTFFANWQQIALCVVPSEPGCRFVPE